LPPLACTGATHTVMNKFLSVLLILSCIGCVKKREQPTPPPPIEVEIKDFIKVELSNKYSDTLNAWLRDNPQKRIVTFYVDRCVYLNTVPGDNFDQKFVQVEGDTAKLQTYLNEHPCKVVAVSPLFRSFLVCISEQ
jgi:hypothetical protein